MKKTGKIVALTLGSLLAVSALAACAPRGEADTITARICYDNLPDDGITLATEDTSIFIPNATNIKALGRNVNANDVATYSGGTFTAKGSGTLLFEVGGKQGRLEVVPAYVTDPGYQYGQQKNGLSADLSLTPGTLLGNTHDPSFIETIEDGSPVYYLFSTGWTGGNDIHRSYDLLEWEYVGKTVHGGADAQLPQNLKTWENANTVDNISWWAPDIVPAPGGGYWMYTCTTQLDGKNGTTKTMKPLTQDEKGDANTPTGVDYSNAAIILYYTDSLDKDWKQASSNFEYKGILMQSSIPQDGSGGVGEIDINSIDPQIIYTPDGKMYMAYGSFGTGNWILELDPATGLRKDGVYADGVYKTPEFIRKERNKVVSGDEANMTGTKYKDDFLAGKEVTSDFYGKMISLGAEEAPVIARHDNVQLTDENGNALEGSGKTYYYSMHSYNWLESNYQMWGGRSENVTGAYQSASGGLVYNENVGHSENQGNKYMGAFQWRAESKSANNKEINIALPGHNDLYTTADGTSLAAYITRTWDYNNSEYFCVQVHQYYLNSYGDICINPNRYGLEIDRTVTEEELLAYTDGGRFEMVVMANAEDAHINSPGNNATLGTVNNISVEVVLGEDHTIKKNGTQIGTWKMYGKGYIKLEFTETQKTSGGQDSLEKVYYGVVRPAWLGNRNQSGFTITAMGHTEGKKTNMPIFFNNYSTIEGDGLKGE